jgi:hypothetical protein
MKSIWAHAAPLAIIAAATALAGPAAAQNAAAGHWAVEGKVGDKAFTLDCHFTQTGQALAGACVDGDTHDARVKGGRSHTLTKGSLVGDQIAFTYQSSFLFTKFDAVYTGVLHGDSMSGALTALGAKGTFSGHRAGS